jgi:hypothetical protein
MDKKKSHAHPSAAQQSRSEKDDKDITGAALVRPDPLIGWHSLGKVSRHTRQAKRGWKRKARGIVRGIVRGDLLALLLVLVVALLMLAGVVQ